MKNKKMTMAFVGYKEKYEQDEISVLSGKHITYHIKLSRWLVKLISLFSCSNKKLYHAIYGYLIRNKLKGVKDLDIIFSTDSLRDIKAISSLSIRKVLVFRNVTDGSLNKHLNDFDVFTFDSNDAEKYGFKLTKAPLPLLSNIDASPEPPMYDISFVGVDKGRAGYINSIKSKLEGYTCHFLVFPNKPRLTYKEYLSELLSATCVLEVPIDGQVGDTMRVKEALFSKRKIVSSNVSLYHHPLYTESNFLIYKDLDDLACRLRSFLDTPFDDSVVEKIAQYSVDNVYEKLIVG